MKRIVSSIKQAKKWEALSELEKRFRSEGFNCIINKKHHCLDILDENGLVSRQVYAKEDGTVPSSRVYYQFVGQGNGDYRRLSRQVNETRYTDNDPYMKFVSYTNDPKDTRCAEGAEL